MLKQCGDSRGAFMRYQSGALKHNLMGALLVLVAFVAMMWAAFPPSYGTDLSLIGQGKPAIVLIFDKENVASMDLMEEFNQIRDDYEGKIEFLVADVGTAVGEQFSSAHNMGSASAVYFMGGGEKVIAFYGPQDRAVLRDSISQAFGL